MRRSILFFLFGIFVAGASFSQDDLFNSVDVAMIQEVASVEISDDGEHIAFTVSNPADPLVENKSASYNLHIHHIKTGKSVPFVLSQGISQVSFRPGRNAVTFLSRRDGDATTALYQIDLSGGEAHRIFEHRTSIRSYDWAPDGHRLVFIASQSSETNGSLPYKPRIFEEDLALSELLVGTVETGAVRRISSSAHFTACRWSPDGTRIAAIQAPTALVDDRYMSRSMAIVDPETLEVTDVIDHKAKLGDFCWSPDGQHLAIIAGKDQHDPKEARLFTYAVEKKSFKQILAGFKGAFEAVAWVNRQDILFVASESTSTTIGTVNAKGKGLKRILDKERMNFSKVSMDNNGSLAFAASTARHPNELYYLGSDDVRPIKLTETNPWLSAKKTGVQEIVKYKARDGFEVEGILIRPVDEVPGLKYPLVVYVHGGPESHENDGWLTSYSRPGQVAAGMGIAVFYPNYRGSTGRGLEIAMSSQGDPAGKEFEDIIDGVDYLIETGLVDGEKVGVTGGSYGGYATAWMATRYTDRFAAGVMSVGISDNISKWGTSDIPEEMFLVHSRKRIWEDYDFFLKRSPIYYAGQAKTPLLILHGENDTRVDPGQSKELYRHIKTRTDTPVRLVLYPGEGHGNRKSTARFDYNSRMLRWFRYYLQGVGSEPPKYIDVDLQAQ